MRDSGLKEQALPGRQPGHPPRDAQRVPRAEVPRFSVQLQRELGEQPITIIDQVKSGRDNVSHIRDLKGVLNREKAAIGVYISLEEPTQPMKTKAVSAGFYTPDLYPDRHYPRIQLFTIKDLLDGKRVEYPSMAPHNDVSIGVSSIQAVHNPDEASRYLMNNVGKSSCIHMGWR